MSQPNPPSDKPPIPLKQGPASEQPAVSPADAKPADQLERGTYEIIRGRLKSHAEDLRQRLAQLNDERRKVFGSIPTKLLSTQRVTTSYNCTPQDIAPVGDHFVFGYNVHMGLKNVTELADVFSVYRLGEDGLFHESPIDRLKQGSFEQDFFQLYKYYKETRFLKFHSIGPNLYFVFQVGKTVADIKAFKFLIQGDQLKFVDSRSDHEIVYPPQHDFKWVRCSREMHRGGAHPHISIEDRVFVETIGGDLTIKIEDNTDDGKGIYSEPVDDRDQTLDDAEISYSIVGNLILLKIRPFKETKFRYVIFNEKTSTAQRMDSMADACVFLPEDHGLIFANGYYLQSGVSKVFESGLSELVFERRIASPNGEDYLYVFYNRRTGQKVLLSYNMISQLVETPIICHGFSIFENGQLIYFRTEPTPQKHHSIQIWQTPYVGENIVIGEKSDAYLYKIGNKDVVRAMAESNEILNLIDQEDSYANLYVDLVKASTDIVDSYFWLKETAAYEIAKPIGDIRSAATAAVDEFEKVVRVRQNTQKQLETITRNATQILSQAVSKPFRQIDDFVVALAGLRSIRGQVISLKELKYVDLPTVEALETKITQNSEEISKKCVAFLLKEDSLAPYAKRVDEQRSRIESLKTGVEAKALNEELAKNASELEMLIEIVSNLKIDDATQRTRIIDNISSIYSNLNQTRATLKKKAQSLLSVEGEAEFNSQIKLISQAVVNYLDVCDTPARCDEYLTKMMVQVEEVEGRFAEFDQFLVQLAEKREEIYAAFDTKKVQLLDARSKRATAIMNAADRILKGIRSRVSSFDKLDEINSYFSADMMVEKVRELIVQLQAIEESVKVDDIQSRLKTIREDAIRQLRDKQELYVGGQNVIQFGKYKFSVNTQPLNLTTVLKEDELFFHLSGTNYFEKVRHEGLLSTRRVWDQSVVSEDGSVYRAEYLAYLLLQKRKQDGALNQAGGATASVEESSKKKKGAKVVDTAIRQEPELLAKIQEFMAPRYAEGYIKGVHDHDAALILQELLRLDANLRLLKYASPARAQALLFWTHIGKVDHQLQKRWQAKFVSLGVAQRMFEQRGDITAHVAEMAKHLEQFVAGENVGDPKSCLSAAEFLYEQLSSDRPWVCSIGAKRLQTAFEEFLGKKNVQTEFQSVLDNQEFSLGDRFSVVRDWLTAYVRHAEQKSEAVGYLDEAAALIICGKEKKFDVVDVAPHVQIDGLLGDHPRIDAKAYRLDYHEFMERIRRFESETVPAFESYLHLKKSVLDQRRAELKLEEFAPRVLTSFVRNRLINDTYLPLVGANLAKQMGVVGEEKRTDLMGMLLLISPPGYGKTTLMEYVANRLGITFMKINGPAVGHQVTSLDPLEAPNASAREEIEKLNLALEMGDNVMIYVDDIQHCNPEFLQKFISLCDATRRIEGVFQGRTRTYDLRGRKVAVVMAGNPYTESGEKFQIPDMLASRADTYNLGDVIGGNQESFELSYLENCLTSNTTLAKLNSRSQADVYSVIKMAERPEAQGIALEGTYSIEEINEFVAVMKKLLIARELILKVNRQYIDSAAQADAYRTEPPFKLQGSYRDMNKIAEKIVPIMNDEELNTLIISHYQNQAQTLTTGAQVNLLKLQELMSALQGADLERWNEIKRTFKRNLILGGASEDNQFGQVLGQMSLLSEGLVGIKAAMSKGMEQLTASRDQAANAIQTATMREVSHAVAELAKLNQSLEAIREQVKGRGVGADAAEDVPAAPVQLPQKIEVINKIPNVFMEIIRNQFLVMQSWIEPMLRLSEENPNSEELKKAIQKTETNYKKLVRQVGDEEEVEP